jgi:hypothetical protein
MNNKPQIFFVLHKGVDRPLNKIQNLTRQRTARRIGGQLKKRAFLTDLKVKAKLSDCKVKESKGPFNRRGIRFQAIAEGCGLPQSFPTIYESSTKYGGSMPHFLLLYYSL